MPAPPSSTTSRPVSSTPPSSGSPPTPVPATSSCTCRVSRARCSPPRARRPSAGRAARRRGERGGRGRWAQGLEPRYFTWVITGRLAVSERPGGFARNHRKVRRQEELLWLAGHGFTHVLSLL